MIGIYKIKSLINNKVYIGSSNNIEVRWNSHIRELESNKHSNKHLQNAWNKYGRDNFIFEVIEECNIKELLIKEKLWIEYYNATNPDFGYNIVNIIKTGKKYNNATTRSKRLSENTVSEIKELLSKNISSKDINNKYNIPVAVLYKIKNLESYRDIRPDLNMILFNIRQNKALRNKNITFEEMYKNCQTKLLKKKRLKPNNNSFGIVINEDNVNEYIGICLKCGCPFVQNYIKTKKYCSNCSGYTKKPPIIKKCIDCGVEMILSANSFKRLRCDSCNKKYRKISHKKYNKFPNAT